MSRHVREQLKLFAERPDDARRRRSPDGITTSKLVCSAYIGLNEDLFPLILDLHVPAGSIVADVTYGKGIFWKNVPNGVLIVKCQDEVSANTQHLTHVEIIVHY